MPNSIILVAGQSTSELKDFLLARGSIEVVAHFPSLHYGEEILKNNYHQADKLVYICQNQVSSVRKDMGVLSSLLLTDAFFKISSIVFITPRYEGHLENVKYFNYVMEDVKRESKSSDKHIVCPEYSIVYTNDIPAFDQIYREILGMGEGSSVVTTRRKLYRVEKGSNSKTAYEPEPFSSISMVPYDFENLKKHADLKNQVIAADPGIDRIDTAERMLAEKTSPEFDRIPVKDLGTEKTVIVGTGISKSGITTFLTGVVSSAVFLNKKALLIDLSDNKSWINVLEKHRVVYQEIPPELLLLSSRLYQSTKVALIKDFEASVFSHVIAHILSNIRKIDADLVVFDMSIELYNSTKDLFSIVDHNLIVCGTTYEPDLFRVMDLQRTTENVSFVLSNVVSYSDGITNATEIKEMLKDFLGESQKIYKPIDLSLMDVDEALACHLLGW